MPITTGIISGKVLIAETSQKTCLCIYFIAFEEKALSLMSRNYSIRHFIHHSDSEKVSYDNKLCQVYLVCPAEVTSSGHFNSKKTNVCFMFQIFLKNIHRLSFHMPKQQTGPA